MKVLLFWVVMPRKLGGRYQRLEKHTNSIFRAEHGFVSNETNVMGNYSAQSRFKTIAQQSFHVTLHVTSSLRKWHFKLNHNLQYYFTDFMQLVLIIVFDYGMEDRGSVPAEEK
jgi:hypothetical protein